MVEFAKPTFTYNYQVTSQINALREYERTEPGRDIPDKRPDRLLVATWNVANLGQHDRRPKDYRIVAEIVSWFDITAVQEVKDNLEGLRQVQSFLPSSHRVLFSDRAGNDERLAFIYDGSKVTLLEKVGEVAIPASAKRYINLPGISQKFRGFDRHPYLAAFSAGSATFLLASVHLYYGSNPDHARDINRRSLEAYAVSRWADLRRRSQYAYTTNIIALGDFNLPMREPGDPIYDALTRRGLRLPEHSTRMGSNLRGDKHYDQIAFFPGSVQSAHTASGVFDFDGAIFSALWNDPNRTENDFFTYVRYYISDHRPLWAEFRLGPGGLG